ASRCPACAAGYQPRASRPSAAELHDGDAVTALVRRGVGEALDGPGAPELLPDRVAQRARPLAVEDADGVDAEGPRLGDVVPHGLERLLDPGAAHVELALEGRRPGRRASPARRRRRLLDDR